MTKIEGNHHIHGTKNITFSYSDPGGTLEKNKQPKTLKIFIMNRYTSKSYTTSKNAIDRQYTERGQL